VIDSSPAARETALSQLLTLSASVSYTDAVVMAVADEYETQKIFDFDEAFANCGYENIPRRSEAAVCNDKPRGTVYQPVSQGPSPFPVKRQIRSQNH
jgi:hypothetical protein